MKKLVFALLLLAGCVGKAPDHTLRAAPNANVAQFSVCDQSGYCLPVTDAGLPTTATLTGSVTVGTVGQGAPNSAANAWPTYIVDGGVNVNNNPGVYLLDAGVNVLGPVQVFGTVDASVSVSNTVTVTGSVTVGTVGQGAPNSAANAWPTYIVDGGVMPAAPYASISQWWATAGSGTVKEAGATLYALTCTNLNSYGAWIQVFNQVTTPATDTGAFAQWYVPANGEIVIGTDDLTASGISLTTGLSWGMSTVTRFYNATAVSPNCNFTYQ